MSLDIRYLTNGEKEVFTVHEKGTEPSTFQIFKHRDEIDKNIRHYAPDKPTYCEPDLARYFGVLDELYPNHPNCAKREYKDKKCLAESCIFNNYSYTPERGTCPRIGTAMEYHPKDKDTRERHYKSMVDTITIPKECIEIALALETLAFHNKNLLSRDIQNDCDISSTVQVLLKKALQKL